MRSKKTIHITCGDPDGIGLEVTLKALKKIGPVAGVEIKLWRPHSIPKNFENRINSLLKLKSESRQKTGWLIDCPRKDSPADWVESASKEIMKDTGILVTGPLSKTLIKNTGRKDLGHNEILKRLTKSSFVRMFFIGSHFNVLLATGHMPLKEVEKDLLNKGNFDNVLRLALDARARLPEPIRKKKIGLLGLNPHAGEEGMLGDFENKLKTKLSKSALYKRNFSEPLVPDVAFQKKFWKRYSLYVALYHDQGLIPFKMSHGQSSGIQVSLGLPFLRVSVDHGTAKDIFNRNIANAGSMTEAIRFAINSLNGRR